MANRNNTFILKRSNVVGKIPPLSGLTLGELALNTADAKLYTLYTGGLTGATEVREIGWNRLSVSGGTLYGNLNVLGSVSATTFFGSGANLINIPDTFVTGFTFSSNTLTISQNQGKLPLTASISTIDLSNIFSAVTFNIGTTGSISATTFFGSGAGLTGINDFYVTGGTYSNGNLTLNRQNGSIIISGFSTGYTLTSSAINTALGYTPLSADTFVTGFTYSNNNLTILQNQGQPSLSVNISTMTGLTVNGNLSTTTLKVTSGATTGYVLTALDSNGNTYWAPSFSGGSSSSVDTFVTGFTYSNNNLTILQNQGQLPLTVNISSMTGLTINGGLTATTITSTDLSGNGDRIVIASSVGTLSASSQSIIQTYIDPTGTVAGYLDNTSNWDINGIYTGPTISGTYQGQKHYNLNYFFEAVDDNLWIRLIRG